MGVTAAAFFIYLYLPIVILLILSFNASRSATIWTGLSPDWYEVVLRNPDILRAAKNSLIVASTATLVSTALATMAALGMAGSRFPGQPAASGLVALPLVVPEIVTAVATLLFFVLIGMRLGLATVMVAHTVFCIPFAYLPIRARLEGMDKALTEAAADLYANPWQAFRRVTLPLLWPGILSGAMLAFIISLDDFVITFFVSGRARPRCRLYWHDPDRHQPGGQCDLDRDAGGIGAVRPLPVRPAQMTAREPGGDRKNVSNRIESKKVGGLSQCGNSWRPSARRGAALGAGAAEAQDKELFLTTGRITFRPICCRNSRRIPASRSRWTSTISTRHSWPSCKPARPVTTSWCPPITWSRS